MTRGPMTSIGPYRVSFSIAFALHKNAPAEVPSLGGR